MTTIPETREHDGYEIRLSHGKSDVIISQFGNHTTQGVIAIPVEILDQVCESMKKERDGK